MYIIVYCYGLISKLPRRTIAEILAPCSVMKDRKFELRVDDWKFVGHPFSYQAASWFVSCNIAFVLQVRHLQQSIANLKEGPPIHTSASVTTCSTLIINSRVNRI